MLICLATEKKDLAHSVPSMLMEEACIDTVLLKRVELLEKSAYRITMKLHPRPDILVIDDHRNISCANCELLRVVHMTVSQCKCSIKVFLH